MIAFGSCATLINGRTTDVKIISKTDSVEFFINMDTAAWFNTPKTVTIDRSKNALLITAKKDTVQKVFSIKSKFSRAFFLGDLFAGVIVGYTMDLFSPKRFTYPSEIMIDFDKNTYSTRKPFPVPEKGLLDICLSIPEGNLFYMRQSKRYGSSSGFLGLAGEAQYYMTSNHSIDVNAGIAIDNLIPIPVGVDGDNSRSAVLFAAAKFGSDFKRIHYAGGFQISRSFYSRYNIPVSMTSRDSSYRIDQNNAGLALSAYHRFSKTFLIGANYNPSLFAWENKKVNLHYSHLISFDLIFQFEIRRPEKEKE